jgi:hypothetical protein
MHPDKLVVNQTSLFSEPIIEEPAKLELELELELKKYSEDYWQSRMTIRAPRFTAPNR